MGKRLDLTGQRFIRWLIIDINPEKSKEMGRVYWNVICKCGNKGCVSTHDLRNNHSKSCGCFHREIVSGKNNSSWNGGKATIICKQCGKKKKVKPYRKEISKFCSKKCHGKWMSENQIGENHPHWQGGKVTIICEQCGKEKKVWPCEKDNARFCGRECQDKWKSENIRGKNHPNWKGEIISLYDRIRHSEKYMKFIQNILKRDNYTCQLSDKKGNGDLNVHHIKGFAKILEENNITTLEEAENCKELWNEDNCITLIEKWHIGQKTDNPLAFHKLYGTQNFTEQNFYEWFDFILKMKLTKYVTLNFYEWFEDFNVFNRKLEVS